ncbi:MAG: hypothetical protein LBG94_04080 [Treponema sp.]|nr:hypothetical protein [Treponema sp.]
MNIQDRKVTKKSLLAEAQRFKKSIGTKNESSLHRTLKFQYTGTGGKSEVEVGEYVADGVSKEGEYIEVQTGSFAPLRKKAPVFAANGRVRIIHPVAVTKRIEVFNPEGKLLYKRKSPVHGSKWDIFDALLHAPELPLIKGLNIELAFVDITEKRIKDGKGSWRRKGISIQDREMAAWHESLLFTKPKDYLIFIPFKKKEEFTVSSLAQKAEITINIARKALYVLTKIKVVKRIGKKSRAWVYVI